ncbi:APC family permease [Desulfurococcus mucosus]|uniref:Amino acid permease-associated region n=1 Tax=Desulfurococcus mucosus (strain ATCC 35584 / DSM 2162 / JCM 9187 / O7/1) TaxID=765177 RepID=E8R7C5_DESM0|nr:APC family permease [Desulfurococcus mucosus]ADV65590.1 amino acid permease-associated region [Desulfurococcus mucosus DSM 2162]
MSLKRVLDWYHILALGVAGIVGTSWVYLNTTFYDLYGPGGVILGYIVATVMASLMALAYSEMGSAINREGGEVAFVYPALGAAGSFFVAWMFLLGMLAAALSFYVIGIAFLLSWVFPQLNTMPLYYVAGYPVYLPWIIVGYISALIVFALNYFGAKLTGNVQTALFILLILCGAILVAVAAIYGSLNNFMPPFKPGTDPAVSAFRFALLGIGYLSGFETLPMIAEESKVSPRKFGYLVALSAVLAGMFYTLMMFAGALIIPWQGSSTVAPRGLIDEMSMIHPALGWVAWLASFLGLVTSWIPALMTVSRMIYALARGGLFPKQFEYLHPKYGVPTRAMVFVLAISLILGLLGRKGLVWFLDVSGVTLGVCWLTTVITMLICRKRYPQLERPFRVPAAWLVGPLALIIGLIVVVTPLIPGTDVSLVWPYEYVLLIAWVLLGIFVYFAYVRKRIREIGLEKVAKGLLGEYYDELYGERK